MQAASSREPVSSPPQPTTSPRAGLMLMSLSTLYQYMYCMLVSSAASLTPVFGGALYMSARVSTELFRLWDVRQKLPRAMRVTGTVLLILMLLCNILLLAVYPLLLSAYTLWILFAVALMLTLRADLAKRLATTYQNGAIAKRMFIILFALLEFFPIAIMAAVFFTNLPGAMAWRIFTGFVLGALLEGYGLFRERKRLTRPPARKSIPAEALLHTQKELRAVNAYHNFEHFHTLIMMALQITLVLVYTFVGLSIQELFTRLLLCAALTLLTREAFGFLFQKLKPSPSFATGFLVLGLFLWISGLTLFYNQLGHAANSLVAYLSLGLSVGGLSVCVTCLAELEQQMTGVARFGLSDRLEGYASMRELSTVMAILVGQMIALILLTLLCIPAGFSLREEDLWRMAKNVRPLMILPPVLLLVAALTSVLHFPMNHRAFQKLRRFLTLRDAGGNNPALEKQLDQVVVKRHKNRFGLKLLLTLLRPLYYHKVVGTENAAPYEEGSIILVCNHGEVYGPVVTNLYVPVPFRPWVHSNMMDKDALVEHVYEGTMIRQKWLPEKWKKPLVRLFMPLFLWVFNSLDGIPVYRGKPKELIKTFRLSAEAMQAGDNILLFPENGEDHELGEKGYPSQGIAQLYTGFAMLAPAYYAKTGKRAVFLPLYASKRLHTLTIGQGIVYDPTAPAQQEKLRIVDELYQSMHRLYQREQAESGNAQEG